MHNIERVIGIMDRITALGVTLSLDDFGTGYSSLVLPEALSDRHAARSTAPSRRGIPGDTNDCAIASTIISIGQQLKHRVIAEGVENVEQLAFLRATGCDEIQGYFSRPVAADEFEAMLIEDRRLLP